MAGPEEHDACSTSCCLPSALTQADIFDSEYSFLSAKETNFIRFCHLIQKVAPQAVRHRFDQEFPPSELERIIQSKMSIISDLRTRRVITHEQMQLICSTGITNLSLHFDITIMLCLLRHLSNVSPLSGQYNTLPPSTDITLGADLARMKFYRNHITHCIEKDRKLDNHEFPHVWDIATKAIGRIGGKQYQQECASLLTTNLDSSFMDIIREFLEMLKREDDPIPKHERDNINDIMQQWKACDNKFAMTRVATKLMKSISSDNIFIVTGSNGSGKSFTVQHVLLCLKEEGYDVIPVTSASDMVRHFCRSRQQIFFIDDLLGRYNVSKSDIEDWERNHLRLKDILNCCKCVFTCRLQIIYDSLFKTIELKKYKVIVLVIELSVEEKLNIGKQYLNQDVLKRLSYNTIRISTCFPMLCSLYSKHEETSTFFQKPEICFMNELDEMKLRPSKIKYACIALCVMLNNIVGRHIFKDSVKDDVHEIMSVIYEELEENVVVSKKAIISEFNSMIGSFFKITSFGYQSLHYTLFDIFCTHVSKKMTESFIRYADSQLLSDRAVLQSVIESGNILEKEYEEWIRKKRPSMLQGGEIKCLPFFSMIEEDETECCPSMIIISTNHEDIFLKRMMKDYINGKVCNVFESYQMMAKSYRFQLISFFLKENINLNIVDKNGKSALSICAEQGYFDIIDTMCSTIVDVNLSDMFGRTPLHSALYLREKHCAEILLGKGANVNKCDMLGRSPLWVASFQGYENIVQTLFFKGADINQCDNHGKSPLFIALSNRHKDCAEILLKLDVSTSKCDEFGKSSLCEASAGGYTNIVKTMYERGADVNKCNDFEMSPLVSALRCGQVSCAKFLITVGADVNKCDSSGHSPLHAASLQGLIDIAKILIEKGADINKCDNSGRSPLQVSLSYGNTRYAEVLVEIGADVNKYENSGVSPLYMASAQGFIEIVQLLCDKGADVYQCDNYGTSSLVKAIVNGHKSCAEILLTYGADVNKGDTLGQLPLYEASCQGFTGIVKTLCEKGADVNQCGTYEKSPLFIASNRGHKSCAEILIKFGAM